MKQMDGHWTVAKLEELLAGMGEPDAFRTLDAAGMTPAISAALHSAVKTGLLMALLDTAEGGGAQSAITRLEVLLEENNNLLRTLVETNRALVGLLSTRAARQAALDQARAAEDAAIEEVRAEATQARARRPGTAASASAG